MDDIDNITFEAAASGDVEFFQAFDKNGALAELIKALQVKNPKGQTPLMVAAMNGRIKVLEKFGIM